MNYLPLYRKCRYDVYALLKLRHYIEHNNIDIVHAHGSSLFVAAASLFLRRDVKIVWHDHYGPRERNKIPYLIALRSVAAVISVNSELARWAHEKLRVDSQKIHYIPNFVPMTERTKLEAVALPGISGKRIACVAGLRPVKNQILLIRAMKMLCEHEPDTFLFLIGKETDLNYTNQVRQEIDQLGLSKNVLLLGERKDVPNILQSIDIGVLSSHSEGFPLALLEYGRAALPVVCSNVGQCAEILDYGRAGCLVPVNSPVALATSLLVLLRSTEKRRRLGHNLFNRVLSLYSTEVALNSIIEIYNAVVNL